MVIAGNTKSDELSDLRKLFTTDGPFSVFGSIFEVKLILDANSVLADIRWLVKIFGVRVKTLKVCK